MLARAFRCSLDEAYAMVTAKERAHTHVAAVGAMARALQVDRGGQAAATASAMPPGCTTVFRRGDDWEARLRSLLETVAASRADHAVPVARL